MCCPLEKWQFFPCRVNNVGRVPSHLIKIWICLGPRQPWECETLPVSPSVLLPYTFPHLPRRCRGTTAQMCLTAAMLKNGPAKWHPEHVGEHMRGCTQSDQIGAGIEVLSNNLRFLEFPWQITESYCAISFGMSLGKIWQANITTVERCCSPITALFLCPTLALCCCLIEKYKNVQLWHSWTNVNVCPRGSSSQNVSAEYRV